MGLLAHGSAGLLLGHSRVRCSWADVRVTTTARSSHRPTALSRPGSPGRLQPQRPCSRRRGRRTAAPSSGRASGDPHITTFDGLDYDFQAVGEFVAVRSGSDDLEIQVRQEPAPRSNRASMNTAVATLVGNRRVALELDDGARVLRVDGQETPATGDPIPLDGGGEVLRAENGVTVTWPDGECGRDQAAPRPLHQSAGGSGGRAARKRVRAVRRLRRVDHERPGDL